MSYKEATWNHRVIEFVEPNGDPWFAIHEVHYLSGRPCMYTENPVPVCGETVEELGRTLKRMADCLASPPLKETDFDIGSDTEKRVDGKDQDSNSSAVT